MDSRKKLILFYIFIIPLILVLFQKFGYINILENNWKIRTMQPCFADTRIITSGYETVQQGFDPMINPVADPWNRKLVYPRVWQGLYYLGIKLIKIIINLHQY